MTDDPYEEAGSPSDTKEKDVAKQPGRPEPLPEPPAVGGKNG